MLRKKLPMAMFWTLVMVLWVTNEISWILEGHRYALPGVLFAVLGIWACVSQWRLYFDEKKTGQNEKRGGSDT